MQLAVEAEAPRRVNTLAARASPATLPSLTVLAPGGSGKTVIFCHLAKALNRRTLILAHRVELLQQTADKMRRIWPEAEVGMINRKNRGDPQFNAQVVIASVQTAIRPKNLARLVQRGFDVIIVDEAHHAPASSYSNIFESLAFLGDPAGTDNGSGSSSDLEGRSSQPLSRQDLQSGSSPVNSSSSSSMDAPDPPANLSSSPSEPRSKASLSGRQREVEDLLDLEAPSLLQLAGSQGDRLLVGFTATPFRLDKKKLLGDVFQEIVYQRDLLYMVHKGYLAPPLGYRIMTDSDISQAAAAQGDFRETELEQLVNTSERNSLAARAYTALAGGRRAIVFCVGVEHSLDMAAAFEAAGIPCAAVHGKLPAAEREDLLRKFKEGEYQVLSNCMILSEGYDESIVSAVVMARPTKSPALYTQCIGRGLRLHEGKEDCIVIDLTDRHHDIATVASLSMVYPDGGGGGPGRPPPPPGPKDAKVNLAAAVRRGRLDLLARSYCWVRFPGTDHLVISLFTPAPSVRTAAGQYVRAKYGPQWCIWLIALEMLPQQGRPGHPKQQQQQQEQLQQQQQQQQPEGEPPAKKRRGRKPQPKDTAQQPAEASVADSATSSSSGSGDSSSTTAGEASTDRQLRYLTYVMRKDEGEPAQWHLAGPDASKRAIQEPPRALPLEAAMSWAEHLLRDGFRSHAERNQADAAWRKKPASDKQKEMLRRMAAEVVKQQQKQAQQAQQVEDPKGTQQQQQSVGTQKGHSQQQQQEAGKQPQQQQQQQETGKPGEQHLPAQQQQQQQQQQWDAVETGDEEWQAGLEQLSRLQCGEASDFISAMKLARWYQEGLIRFPTMYVG
ncbi:hypothetical protein N2152v2_005306 [Parachlorella kessleri]